MPHLAVARAVVDLLNDNQGTGQLLVGDPTLKVGGFPVSVDLDFVAGHGNHTNEEVFATSTVLFVNGKAVVRLGDRGTLLGTVVTASDFFFSD